MGSLANRHYMYIQKIMLNKVRKCPENIKVGHNILIKAWKCLEDTYLV